MLPPGLWLALVGLAACAPAAPVASLGDGRTGTIHFILPSVQNGSGCDLVERTPGVAVHRASGAPATRGDPCVRFGATVGSEPRAQGAAIAAVKEFLTATFGLARQ